MANTETKRVMFAPDVKYSVAASSTARRSLERPQVAAASETTIEELDVDVFKPCNHQLDFTKLEQLVCFTIPKATGYRSCTRFRGLAARCRVLTANWDLRRRNSRARVPGELLDVADWLMDVLNDERHTGGVFNLTTTELSIIHLHIAYIRQWKGDTINAHKSYVAAAWLTHRSLLSSSSL